MYKLSAALLASVLLAGCVADQGRDNPNRDVLTGIDIKHETELHGRYGQKIAELFNTGKVADARNPMSGKAEGLQLNRFYNVQIAEDPLRPTILTQVGYVRRLKEDRGDFSIFEFYDAGWQRIGYMDPNGALYRYKGNGEVMLGRFELDDAVRALFHAPSGYGYDSVLQDESLANMKDPNVVASEPRARGVYHRSHKSAPPVVVFTAKRAGEAEQLADKYEKEKFDAREREELERMHQDDTGGIGDDGTYGGLTYKHGNPVDDKGHPLKPGSVK